MAASPAVSKREWILAISIGLGLSVSVWWTLCSGGGLVGGDTYPYFFPQKQIMAEAFLRGEIPLWHDRTGLGYPLHAESQAGVFYPANQVLYRLLDVNSAYSTNVVLHYFLAFVFAWRFVRTQQVSCCAAMFAAMVYVYGWFPARISLEWSIIGGVWFPAALWMTNRLLHHRNRWNALLLSVALALHLLAGHFALAFITQLSCCLYAIFFTAFGYRDGRDWKQELPLAVGSVLVCIGTGLLLASIQLIPTLELKQLSQREGANVAFDPGYGHMPPIYLTQIVASWWYWHTPEMVQSNAITQHSFLSIPSATNKVEAHLYFGLIPPGLMLMLLNPVIRARIPRHVVTTWLVLMGLSIIYATGWPLVITRHLPGFAFFMGPARYTIVAALAGAILAGLVLDSLTRRRSTFSRVFAIAAISAITLPDLLKSSEWPVRDAVAVDDAPYASLDDSWIRDFVAKAGEGNVRLLAPGPNVSNLYGSSCIPQYLGIGPADYYVDEKTYRVQPSGDDDQPFPSSAELEKLRERSVTHILATEPFSHPSGSVNLIHAAPDAFLNRVWSRGSAPVYLYELNSPKSRVSADPVDAVLSWSWIHRTPESVRFEVDMNQEATVILSELMFPGWLVTIDGKAAVAESEDGFERRVRVPAGKHDIHWQFRPRSFQLGTLLSGLTPVFIIVMAIVARRKQKSGGVIVS